jgi:3-oxoacyl-[acyl-carrier-protein] synthase-3
MTRFSCIIGTGSALPERLVSNAELVRELAQRGIESSDEWIVERTGIRQRYIAAPEVSSSVLGAQAARAALASAGVAADSVDLIVVATSTPDYVFPSTACLVQKSLGAAGGAAFDVQAVCSGFVYGMATADAMIKTGMASRALVIGTEVFSRILDWNDRGTCVLFGDGAGAVLLDAGEAPGVLASRLHADGRHEDILRTAGNVCGGGITGHPFLTMDGQAVFKLAVSVLDSVGRETVAASGMTLADVDWLIPHQANVRILQATARRMGIPPERVVVTVDRHANTSAASVPLALDVAMRDGRVRTGQHVLMEGVGGGFTWGATLVRI